MSIASDLWFHNNCYKVTICSKYFMRNRNQLLRSLDFMIETPGYIYSSFSKCEQYLMYYHDYCFPCVKVIEMCI